MNTEKKLTGYPSMLEVTGNEKFRQNGGIKMEVIIISDTRGAEMIQVIDSINILNCFQNYYYFRFEGINNSITENERINWNHFCNEHNDEYDHYRIYITDKAFDDNWFSHEEAFFSIITTHDWNQMYAPPSLKAYILYQISQSVMNFSIFMGESDVMNIYHRTPTGCMFDLNIRKNDIKYGMRSGKLCVNCKNHLLTRGIDQNAINAIENVLEIVRAESFGEPVLIPQKAAFVIMKYTENDANEHGFLYGIAPALQELGIECILANDYPQNGNLLDLIINDIKRCRFIIAKVDVDNERDLRNVYFELGLAKGMGKDVIIICSNNYIRKLPSDTVGLLHITYPEGDYMVLRNSIIDYYTHKFHYLDNAMTRNSI